MRAADRAKPNFGCQKDLRSSLEVVIGSSRQNTGHPKRLFQEAFFRGLRLWKV